MRNSLAQLVLVFGGVLFGTANCGGDEATGPNTPPTTKAAYCEPCDSTSDCDGGMKCKEIGKGSGIGACAKDTDTQCCTKDNKTCRSGLGDVLTGSGGSGGGIINNGGRGGKSGAGGGGGGVKQTHLGQNCVTDADCGDDNLTCVGSTGFSDGTGVPKGLCTMPCTTGADCLDHYDNSFCFQFNDNDMYCIEGCTTGTAGSPKCHSRPEIACSLIGLFPTGTACKSTNDCGSLQLCDSDTAQCGDIVTGCVPQCGGDFDCGAKEYCDFSTGMCTKTKPTGLPLGAACTVPTGSQADPCQGFCDPGSEDPKHGICGGLCSLSPTFAGCGWDGDVASTPDNVCLFGTILSPPGDSVTGDVGLCGALCDCNAQCLREGDYCLDETGGQVKSRFERNGYCRPLDTTETTADSFTKCPSGGGTGGTGGTGGAGGEPGTGATGGTGGGSGGGGEGGEPTSPNGGQSGGN